MTDPNLTPVVVEKPEIVDTDVGVDDEIDETIDHPSKVMRIGTMLKQLLEEVRGASLDEASRGRLREIYDTSITELGSALSPDLREELSRLASPFAGDDTPSGSELQIAKAQLVGWLEGLFHGIQATLFAQQTAARQQLEMMQRSQALPRGQAPTDAQQGGVYL